MALPIHSEIRWSVESEISNSIVNWKVANRTLKFKVPFLLQGYYEIKLAPLKSIQNLATIYQLGQE